MTYDFVVIGGGVSGLSAAAILAKAGRRVVVVEESETPGPVMRGFQFSGSYFETGFHYAGALAPGEPLHRFFAYHGLWDELTPLSLNPAGFDQVRCREDGRRFDFPVGYCRLQEALSEAFPQESSGISAYLRAVRDAAAQMPFLNLEAQTDAGTLLGLTQGKTLQEVLDGFLTDRRLKALLGVHSLLYGNPPEKVAFGFHAGVIDGYYRSAHTLAEGGRGVVDALVRRLKEQGGEIRCGQGARKLILGGDGEVKGVALEDGARLDCQGCILTLHPRLLPRLVPDGVFRPVYKRRLQGLRETLSGFLLFGCSAGPLTTLQGRNLILLDSYSGSGDASLECRPLFVAGSPAESKREGHGLVAILPAKIEETAAWAESTPRGGRPAGYTTFKSEMQQRLLSRIERECPELVGKIGKCSGATPLTVRDFSNNPWGGLYGAGHEVGQFNPQPRTRIPNLFMSGQAVAAPGLLGAVLASFMTCGEILGHEQLRMELKRCS